MQAAFNSVAVLSRT